MSPSRVYLIQVAWRAFAFWLFVSVNLIWQAQAAGLGPLQLVLVGTMLEIVCIVGEIPTGIVADVYSRRLSVVVGFILFGAGCLVEALFPTFAGILASQVIWGTGDTFISGAIDAWLADEIGEERLAPIYLRGSQLAQASAVVAIPFAVLLGNLQLNLPILLAGVLLIALGAFLAATMREPAFQPGRARASSTWTAMAATLRGGIQTIRTEPVIATIVAIAAFHGMASEGIDRLYTPHFLYEVGLPIDPATGAVTWFGFIHISMLLLAIFAAQLVRRFDIREDRQAARLLLVLCVGKSAAIVGFGLAAGFPAGLAAYWTLAMFGRTMGPISQAWLNRGIDPRVRATVLSMAAQADSLGQILGGPLIGIAAETISIRAGIVLAGVVLIPAIFLYARAMRPPRPNPALVS